MQDLSHTRQWSGSPTHPQSLSGICPNILHSPCCLHIFFCFGLSPWAPTLSWGRRRGKSCWGTSILGYHTKTLPDSSGRGRGQQRCGSRGTRPLSWPRVTSQPALRAAEAAGGRARAGPLGRWGKVETTLTHLWIRVSGRCLGRSGIPALKPG